MISMLPYVCASALLLPFLAFQISTPSLIMRRYGDVSNYRPTQYRPTVSADGLTHYNEDGTVRAPTPEPEPTELAKKLEAEMDLRQEMVEAMEKVATKFKVPVPELPKKVNRRRKVRDVPPVNNIIPAAVGFPGAPASLGVPSAGAIRGFSNFTNLPEGLVWGSTEHYQKKKKKKKGEEEMEAMMRGMMSEFMAAQGMPSPWQAHGGPLTDARGMASPGMSDGGRNSFFKFPQSSGGSRAQYSPRQDQLMPVPIQSQRRRAEDNAAKDQERILDFQRSCTSAMTNLWPTDKIKPSFTFNLFKAFIADMPVAMKTPFNQLGTEMDWCFQPFLLKPNDLPLKAIRLHLIVRGMHHHINFNTDRRLLDSGAILAIQAQCDVYLQYNRKPNDISFAAIIVTKTKFNAWEFMPLKLLHTRPVSVLFDWKYLKGEGYWSLPIRVDTPATTEANADPAYDRVKQGNLEEGFPACAMPDPNVEFASAPASRRLIQVGTTAAGDEDEEMEENEDYSIGGAGLASGRATGLVAGGGLRPPGEESNAGDWGP